MTTTLVTMTTTLVNMTTTHTLVTMIITLVTMATPPGNQVKYTSYHANCTHHHDTCFVTSYLIYETLDGIDSVTSDLHNVLSVPVLVCIPEIFFILLK